MRPELTPIERTRLLVWWIIWGTVLLGLTVIYVALGRGPRAPVVASELFVNLVGVVPLFLSIVIRWLVLPRFTQFIRAFVVSIIGMSLAEACGLLGIFLGGPYREDLFVLGFLGVVQFVPLFARRLLGAKEDAFGRTM